MKGTAKKILAVVMTLVLVIPGLSAPEQAEAASKFAVSVKSGTYKKTIKPVVKAKKGYKVYYTTGAKFKAKNVIKSGNKKTFTIKKTTTLKLIVVKKSTKLTTKKLNSKSYKKKVKTYKYKMSSGTENVAVEAFLSKMSLEQKIAQMIMPSLRQWGGKNLQDLSENPELAKVLRRHQYGGVILFGQNVSSSEQVTRLTSALQANNAKSMDADETGVIPYMISADEEGGSVARLSMGTRGTGSMAIGATGLNAVKNAKNIGKVFGEELSSLGINVDLAPCIDVINDLADLGMSTRVYSDDAETNAKLGTAFSEGLGESNVITTYKHFPGAGDGSDYPTSIDLTKDELKNNGLKAYQSVIKNGAQMLMVSATTFPELDDIQTMADGETKGYYPATCSHKIVTDILRNELGFDGVVMTDALEMDQFIVEPDLLAEVRKENPELTYSQAVKLTESKAKLFSGMPRSVENGIQIAKYCINAGCDILLLPTDLVDEDAASYYDSYIAGIASLVKDGEISKKDIDASVKRILTLKQKRGILETDTSEKDIEKRVENAKKMVGSAEHHAVEAETARQAVTLLKNDGVLPISGTNNNIVFVGRTKNDNTPIMYAINQLIESGQIEKNPRIINRITDEIYGDENSSTKITVDYYTSQSGKLVFADELSEAIKSANVVIAISSVSAGNEPLVQLQDSYYVMQGTSRALTEAHAAGAKFVLLSANIPMDTARFQDADAIVCAYLGVGFNIDPTARSAGTENVAAFNANVPAAIVTLFGNPEEITGKLPINIPRIQKVGDRWEFTDQILYARG